MILLLSGIIDTPKCPFFYQNDSFVVPGRDVSMRTNVSIAPWHHLGQFMKLNHITSRQTHTNQHRSHYLPQVQKGKSGLWFFGPFSERQHSHYGEG